MKEVNNDYKNNEMKYNAEGKTLCYLQHEEYIKFYQIYKQNKNEDERHPHGGALQRDNKSKTYYFDSGKEYVMYDLLLSSCIAFSHIFMSP